MAKIGIDARFYGSTVKGLGRYTQKLIEHLEQVDRENKYIIFLRRENFDEYQPFNANFKKVVADYRWYTFAEQIFFPFKIYMQKLDLMHFPHFNVPLLHRGKFVMTIHDLILLHFPTLRGTTLNPLWYRIKYAAYKFNIGVAVRRAQKIITVSNFSKADLLKHYSHIENKLDVTYEACDELCRISSMSSQQILEKYGIIKSYLLYVGNAYPHKNLERLIEAFEIIKQSQPQIQLALVGKEDFFYARLKSVVNSKNIEGVKFLGYVPDQDLDVIYRFASCYVFPSLYEGFGLPPLEAMAKGCAVASSNHQCMQEILGESATYFDGRNPQDIAQTVIRVLEDQNHRQILIEKGYSQIKKYSWSAMANETLAIYNSILTSAVK